MTSPPACGRRDALSVAHSRPHAQRTAPAARESAAATKYGYEELKADLAALQSPPPAGE
jgi:hypothetical protein